MERAWQELLDARLITADATPEAAFAGWLTDPCEGMPSRASRRRAADWALRVARQRRMRALEPTARVLAMVLMALAPQVAQGEFFGSAQISHISGVDSVTAARAFEQLAENGVLSQWVVDPTEENMTWEIASAE
ncbi:hypothetical protein ABZZ04_25845 [Streptomyces sp. NPDC006435]|uniref:hypothetical protein n=1 Tax=Streptomyces sp. NPDC006435 TaxID=3154300 RepID=UPI0033BA3B1B